jgi:hypothetical protein
MQLVDRITARKRLGAVLVSGAVFTGLTLGPVSSASADAGGAAGCLGREASGLSPPGSSDEAPGGMRDFAAFFQENFPPAGHFIGQIAQLHEPSHAACDEAIEELLPG